MMRILKYLIGVLTPVFLIALFASLLTTTPYLSMSEGLYSAHDEIDFDYEYMNRKLIGYMNYRHDNLEFGADEDSDEPLMSESEIIHMEEVRDIYTIVRIAGGASLVVVVLSGVVLLKKAPALFYQALRDIFYVPLFFIMFVGTWMLIDFGSFFRVFHELLFDNLHWQCGPDDAMCLFVPNTFWFVSGMLILGMLALSIVIIMWVNYRYIRPRIFEEE